MTDGETKAYPFALVGFFVTDKDISEAFRQDVTPEELEQLQELLKKTIFTDDVEIAIAPFVVPPDQVNDALNQLADVIFSQEDKQ
ncbi:MAG: hypothetical protein GXO21_05320 [Aquificae bacterium]|nr:hypothetical protein [Aquificota bacterium]